MWIFGAPNIKKLEAAKNVEKLIKALNYKQNWQVRKDAAEALGKIGDPQAVMPLLAISEDAKSDVREAATQAIANIGPHAIDTLTAALKDEDDIIAQSAAKALDKIGDDRAVEPLIEISKDKNEYVREAAFKALKAEDQDHAVEPLIKARGKTGEQSVQSLIATLKDKDKDWRDRKDAAKALGKAGDAGVEPLIAVFKDKDPKVRKAAAEALGEIGKSAVEPLIAALQDTNEEVRIDAAKALGMIGEPCAVESLITAIEDPCYAVRNNAAEALGIIGEPCAVEPLIAALKDHDSNVQYSASKALLKFGGLKVVEAFIAALDDKRSCRQAIWALAEIDTQETLEALDHFFKVSDGEEQRHICVALGTFKGTQPLIEDILIKALSSDETCADAARAIRDLGYKRNWGSRAVEPLIKVLQESKYPGQRRYAAEALGFINDEKAIEPLNKALKDFDMRVADAAARSLKMIDAERRKIGRTHISEFANNLNCYHCGLNNDTKEWPINGDMVGFFYQTEPGKYTLQIKCPHCEKDWYVVWDNDPGPIKPLAHKK